MRSFLPSLKLRGPRLLAPPCRFQLLFLFDIVRLGRSILALGPIFRMKAEVRNNSTLVAVNSDVRSREVLRCVRSAGEEKQSDNDFMLRSSSRSFRKLHTTSRCLNESNSSNSTQNKAASASEFLRRLAEREQEEYAAQEPTRRRVQQLAHKALQDKPWEGDESVRDAVIRVLVDKYKPLRVEVSSLDLVELL